MTDDDCARRACGVGAGPIGSGELGLEGRLLGVGELAAAGSEDLDAVVVPRVVRRGHDRTDDGVGFRGVGHRRRGRDAEIPGLDADVTEPAGEGIDEGGTGLAGVTPDGDRRGAEHATSSPSDTGDVVDAQLIVCTPADAVGTEGEGHRGSG